MDCFVALLLAMTMSADLLKQINRFCLTGKSLRVLPDRLSSPLCKNISLRA